MKFRREIIVSLLSVFLTLVTLVMLVTISYGWFASNHEVKTTGMSVTVAQDCPIKIYDELYTSHIYTINGAKTEVKDTFYRHENGKVLNDQDKGINFSGLIPGEYVDITITYTCSEEYNGTEYELYFSGFDFGIHYNDDAYETADNQESGWFKDGEYYHNVLGVYKFKSIGIKYLDTTKTEVITLNNTYSDWQWFNEYDANKTDTEISKVVLYSDTWNQGDEYVSLTFRVQLDFTQFNAVLSATSHSLSERIYSISSLTIGGVN